MTFPATMRAEEHRLRAYAAITALIRQAQEHGSLRGDFSREDLVLTLMAHAGVVAASGELSRAFSDRLLAYLFEAFAAPGRASCRRRRRSRRPTGRCCDCTVLPRGGRARRGGRKGRTGAK
jgi:hypothetical protein